MSDLEDARKWREHVAKLDALVAFCPTCAEGKVASADMTRDEVIFECGKTVGRSEAARAAPAVAAVAAEPREGSWPGHPHWPFPASKPIR